MRVQQDTDRFNPAYIVIETPEELELLIDAVRMKLSDMELRDFNGLSIYAALQHTLLGLEACK
jgi:hypothetical protein